MKKFSFILTFGLFFIAFIWGCNKDETIPDGIDIYFMKIENYFVLNSYQIDSSIIYLIIKDTTTFNYIFHPAATMEPNDWIKSEDFNNNFVVTIIKQSGNNIYKLDIDRIYLIDNSLNIRYTSKLIEENASYFVKKHLLLMVENCSYNTVIFYENGKIIKQLKK